MLGLQLLASVVLFSGSSAVVPEILSFSPLFLPQLATSFKRFEGCSTVEENNQEEEGARVYLALLEEVSSLSP